MVVGVLFNLFMKKKILFFARDYQNDFFPHLISGIYDSLYVVLTIKEKKKLLQNYNINAIGCFEDYFTEKSSSKLVFDDLYLDTSFFSDRYLGSRTFKERRIILALERDFWRGILTEYRPSAVVNEIVAIEISEVLQIEARKLAIDHYSWMISPFKDKSFYWQESPFHSSLNSDVFHKQPTEESMDFSSRYINKLKTLDNVKPFYAENLYGRLSLSRLFSMVRITIISFFNFCRLKLKRKNRYFYPYYMGDKSVLINNLKNYYNSIIFKYDSIEDYEQCDLVFYPLHYEPEASIIYMSEFYEDQLNLIRNFSKCLRHNQVLAVKEHPQQPGVLLNKEYRKLRKRLSNVMFLPAEYSTKTLILKCELILTQTSTAGWEAIILGKPVVVIGKVFYDKYPFINNFVSFEELKNIIKNKSYAIPDDEATIEYVANFYEYCKDGNPYPHANLYEDRNVDYIREAIENKILIN